MHVYKWCQRPLVLKQSWGSSMKYAFNFCTSYVEMEFLILSQWISSIGRGALLFFLSDKECISGVCKVLPTFYVFILNVYLFEENIHSYVSLGDWFKNFSDQISSRWDLFLQKAENFLLKWILVRLWTNRSNGNLIILNT